MNIDVYTMVWNEERRLPRFLNHYRQFARTIHVADHGSTDRTPELLAAASIRVEHLPDDGFFHWDGPDGVLAWRNNAWKQSRDADWVIVVDVDEILYHHDLLTYLLNCRNRGITVPGTYGFQMIDECRGAPSWWFSKDCIFRPDVVDEINFNHGCHVANPTGLVERDQDPELKLLHYPGWDDPQWLWEKNQKRAARVLPAELALGLSWHYFRTREEFISRSEKLRLLAVHINGLGCVHRETQ